MSATPMYDAVLKDLEIDPERIAARPRWTLARAERALEHRKNLLGSPAPADRDPASAVPAKPQEPPTTQGTHGRSAAAVAAT